MPEIFDDFANAVFKKVTRRRKQRKQLLIAIHPGVEDSPAPEADGEDSPTPEADGEDSPAPAADGEDSPAPEAGGEDSPAPGAVVDALVRRLLRGTEPLVPYAVVGRAGNVAQQIVAGLKVPPWWGRLRFPQYDLFKALGSNADAGMDAQDYAFRKNRYLLRRLVEIPDPPGGWGTLAGVPGFLIKFTGWFEQLRFGAVWRRRMRRNWFPDFAEAGQEDFFERAAAIMRGGDERRKEGALLRALLCDLDSAFTPRVSPWRRRRRTGFVLFVKSDDDLVREAMEDIQPKHVTLIYTRSGQEAKALDLATATVQLVLHWDAKRQEHGNAKPQVRRNAKPQVRRNAEPQEHENAELQVTTKGITADELTAESRVSVRRGSSVLAAVVAGLQVMVLVAAGYVVAAWHFQAWPWAKDETCLGESTGQPAAAKPAPLPSSDQAAQLYKDDKQAIERENKRIVALKNDERNSDKRITIKKVVYLGTGPSSIREKGVAHNGVIPEIRGIRLAQLKMNAAAEKTLRAKSDFSGNVFFHVEVSEAGSDYAMAPAIAEQVVAKSKEDVLGVIGLGESREETVQAVKTLGDGGLPVLGMGATSEDMQAHPLYHQVSFDNPYQTRMFVTFARQANVVRTQEPGRCVPASKALVIGDPADNYSFRFETDLAAEFPIGKDRVIWYPSQATKNHPPGTYVTNDTELLDKACAQLTRDPDDPTVIFWSGRAERLRDFLLGAKDSAVCPASFTVISGADLSTTSVLEDRFPADFGGVTLFYAAHALSSSPPNSVGGDYATSYEKQYGTTKDLWYEHWRGPVAFDGLFVLASGINTVCRENGPAGCGRGSVASHFRYRIGGQYGLRSATGIIRFVKDPWSTAVSAPLQKRFLMLHATTKGPSVVMECGQRDTNDFRTTWGPENAFDCPRT